MPPRRREPIPPPTPLTWHSFRRGVRTSLRTIDRYGAHPKILIVRVWGLRRRNDRFLPPPPTPKRVNWVKRALRRKFVFGQQYVGLSIFPLCATTVGTVFGTLRLQDARARQNWQCGRTFEFRKIFDRSYGRHRNVFRTRCTGFSENHEFSKEPIFFDSINNV